MDLDPHPVFPLHHDAPFFYCTHCQSFLHHRYSDLWLRSGDNEVLSIRPSIPQTLFRWVTILCQGGSLFGLCLVGCWSNVDFKLSFRRDPKQCEMEEAAGVFSRYDSLHLELAPSNNVCSDSFASLPFPVQCTQVERRGMLLMSSRDTQSSFPAFRWRGIVTAGPDIDRVARMHIENGGMPTIYHIFRYCQHHLYHGNMVTCVCHCV